MAVHPALTAPADGTLTGAIDAIADQLCCAVDGDFGFKIETSSGDPMVQKLALLINFTLENARTAIAAEAEARDRLAAALATRQSLERELERKVAELREAERLRTLFLTNMHHELRTPMNAILGMSGILREMARAEAAEIGKFAQHLHDGAQRLNELVEQSLHFTNASDGRIEIRAEMITAAQLIARAMRSVASQAEMAGIRVVVAPEGLEHRLFVDPAHIRRVLVNLISNALKFAPPGSAVGVEASPGADGAYCFVVTDQGPGMTSDEIRRAMQPFTQIMQGEDRGREGSGLGLAVTQALLQSHGGALTLEKGVRCGLVATVTLPAGRVAGDAL